MYFREIYKFSQNCAPNSLHTWVGPEVFLFYGIYSLDVERPPAPSPVSRVGCTLYPWLILPELSTYYAIPAKQYIGKTPDFVRHFDTLIVIRYLSKFCLNDLRPILFVFCNKHLGHITQKLDFWALEKGFSDNFRPLTGFSRPKKTFFDKFDPNVFFKYSHRMGLRTLKFIFDTNLITISVSKWCTKSRVLPTSQENWRER